MVARRVNVVREAPAPASRERAATVLFAMVTDATRANDTVVGNRPVGALRQCLDTLTLATESCGGRVVKTLADTLMALFASPDAAASAAAQMHTAIEAQSPAGGEKVAVRVAFHCGPVIQRDSDVFGDTVNVAWRLVGQATHGQVLTSDDTGRLLSPILRRSTRQLYPIRIKGKSEPVALCELVWRQSPDVTDVAGTVTTPRPATSVLRLRHQGREITRRRAHESIVIGRDKDCALVVSATTASRHHCTIERRQNTFVLQDHSTNGTYVTVAGENEVVVEREDFVLRQHGWISFGAPRGETEEVVEYFCDAK